MVLRRIYKLFDRFVALFGFAIIRRRDVPVFVAPGPTTHSAVELTEEASAYLRPDNERLRELTAAYESFDPAVTTSETWRPGYVSAEDLRYFRGDNAYVWQLRDGNTERHYALTTYYLKTVDSLGLLDRLDEDGAFGNDIFQVGPKVVSRDLLDSITEILFLEKHLAVSRIPELNVLDIGAGYGRLAHRMLTALPNMDTYFCADAFPASTFISEFYLDFRGLAGRAKVLALPEVEEALSVHRVHLAVNIHSFSECTNDAIDWWVRLLARHRVPYLMIVPNARDFDGSLLAAGKLSASGDFSFVLERQGYSLLANEPKYADPAVQRNGVSPKNHFLFRLAD